MSDPVPFHGSKLALITIGIVRCAYAKFRKKSTHEEGFGDAHISTVFRGGYWFAYQGGAEEGPSLEETMEWIKGKILTDAGYRRFIKTGDDYRDYSLRYTDFTRTDPCTVRITSKMGDFDFLENLPLVKVSTDIYIEEETSLPIDWEVIGSRTSYLLYLNSFDGTEIFSFEVPSKGEIKMFNKISLSFDEFDIAQRVAQAFIHAVKLCGGKQELF